MGVPIPDGAVRLLLGKAGADPISVEVVTGTIIDHKQTAHSETHITGGGGSGVVIDGYGSSQSEPIRSQSKSWTVDTVFMKAGTREESFTIRDNVVPLRGGSRASLIYMGRPGDRSWQRIAIYNHDTNQFGRAGGSLKPKGWMRLRGPAIGFAIGVVIAAFIATHVEPPPQQSVSDGIAGLSVIFGLPLALIGLWGTWANARGRIEKRVARHTQDIVDCLYQGRDLHLLESSASAAPHTDAVTQSR